MNFSLIIAKKLIKLKKIKKKSKFLKLFRFFLLYLYRGEKQFNIYSIRKNKKTL